MNLVENGDKNEMSLSVARNGPELVFDSTNQNLSRPKDAVLHAPSLSLREQSDGDPGPALPRDDERKSL